MGNKLIIFSSFLLSARPNSGAFGFFVTYLQLNRSAALLLLPPCLSFRHL